MDIGIIISYPSLAFLIISTLFFIFYWKHYYFVYNHRLFFVVGLVFSRSLAYYSIVDMLMWYFTDHDVDFVRSAILSNIQESLSSLFVIFMAHSADSFVGRYRTLVFSTTAYIAGVMLLVMFNPYDVTWLVVIMLVLLALGRSGDNLLESILIDLVDELDKSEDRSRKRSQARAAIWWRIAHASGAISAIMWVAPFALGGTNASWDISFLICLITMTATLMIFCGGHNVYHQGELTHRPVEIFFRVFRTRIQKLLKSISGCSKNTSTQQRSSESRNPENEGITPERSQLHLDNNGHRNRENNSYKEDLKVMRSLLRMFPMWGTFFVVSLVSAAGSTYYIEQYNNLENKYNIPVQIYNLIQDFSSFSVPFLYHWSCFRQKQKLKICVGMLCSIISCIFAWQLEVHRLGELHYLRDEESTETSISFLWLLPQFFMLGCMEGLTQSGLLNFYKSQVDKPVKNYGEEYMEVVMCLGKLLNIALMLALKVQLGWFDPHVYKGTRLDKYYRVLVYICSANLIIYCCVAKCFYMGMKQDHNSAPQDDLQQHD